MDDVLKEAAKQVPALFIFLVLSVACVKAGTMIIKSFLTQLTETRETYLTQSNNARAEFLRAIERFHDDNIEARAITRSTLVENTQASDKQSDAIHELTIEVRELRSTLQPALRKLLDQ